MSASINVGLIDCLRILQRFTTSMDQNDRASSQYYSWILKEFLISKDLEGLINFYLALRDDSMDWITAKLALELENILDLETY